MLVRNEDPFSQLEGEELATVTFVRDYVQLGFDGPVLTALAPVTVAGPDAVLKQGMLGFSDALIALIGQTVRATSFRRDDVVVLSFPDGWSIAISLAPADCTEPEAVQLRLADSTLFVV